MTTEHWGSLDFLEAEGSSCYQRISQCPAARMAERIRQRAGWLEGQERTLIELVYSRGVPLKQLAELMETRPESLRRKIIRLVKRLNHPAYQCVLENQKNFTRIQRKMLKQHYVQGKTISQIADQCGCSRYQVETAIDRLRQFINRKKAALDRDQKTQRRRYADTGDETVPGPGSGDEEK